MPVYDQSYRTYQGTLRRRGRWAVIVSQELRVLFSKRMFIFLVLLGNIHVVMRIFQIFVFDVVSVPGRTESFGPLSEVPLDETGAWVFLDFLRIQSPLIFLTLIYAGSGLICNDFRNNLVEIYFSKPINWRDYVAGKVMSLVTIGMGLTALPALLLALLHVMFDPSTEAAMETLGHVIPIIAFSLLLVVSFALVILATSSLVDSAKFAGAVVFLLTLINITLGVLMFALLEQEEFLVIAYPVSLNNLGEALFQEHRYPNPVNVPWPWSAAYVAVVCSIALFIICRKARRAETGR
jgi:ABC-type transport system involved in multi-copper enzyme maturation permease subunit